MPAYSKYAWLGLSISSCKQHQASTGFLPAPKARGSGVVKVLCCGCMARLPQLMGPSQALNTLGEPLGGGVSPTPVWKTLDFVGPSVLIH